MTRFLVDEREHRRGLVLGLTLAEVLILLLFMLLLALGDRLYRLEQYKKSADLALGAIIPHLEAGGSRIDDRRAKEWASQLAWMISLEKAFPAFVGKLDVVRDLVEAAVKIEPNDPPIALLRAKAALQKLGPDAGGSELLALEKKVIGVEAKLARVGPVPKPVTKENRNDPPTLLNRTRTILEILDRLIPESSFQASGANPLTTGAIDGKGKHNWPPIITLSEAAGYFFASGSPELSAEFQAEISTTVISRLLRITDEYDVNVIEVVGHTDEQRLGVRPSNLDAALIPFLSGKEERERLVLSDNAGLGLARAASVAHVLLKDERLRRFRILPLSGGQLIEVGDYLSTGLSPGNVKERRRIEIRVRRSEKSAPVWQGRVIPDRPLAPAN